MNYKLLHLVYELAPKDNSIFLDKPSCNLCAHIQIRFDKRINNSVPSDIDKRNSTLETKEAIEHFLDIILM